MSAFVSGWTFGSGWLGNQVDRYEACAAFVEDKFACCQSSSGPAAFNETLLGQEGSPSSSNTTLSSSADDGFWQFFLGIMAVLAASILSPLATWFMSLSHDRRVLQVVLEKGFGMDLSKRKRWGPRMARWSGTTGHKGASSSSNGSLSPPSPKSPATSPTPPPQSLSPLPMSTAINEGIDNNAAAGRARLKVRKVLVPASTLGDTQTIDSHITEDVRENKASSPVPPPLSSLPRRRKAGKRRKVVALRYYPSKKKEKTKQHGRTAENNRFTNRGESPALYSSLNNGSNGLGSSADNSVQELHSHRRTHHVVRNSTQFSSQTVPRGSSTTLFGSKSGVVRCGNADCNSYFHLSITCTLLSFALRITAMQLLSSLVLIPLQTGVKYVAVFVFSQTIFKEAPKSGSRIRQGSATLLLLLGSILVVIGSPSPTCSCTTQMLCFAIFHPFAWISAFLFALSTLISAVWGTRPWSRSREDRLKRRLLHILVGIVLSAFSSVLFRIISTYISEVYHTSSTSSSSSNSSSSWISLHDVNSSSPIFTGGEVVAFIVISSTAWMVSNMWKHQHAITQLLYLPCISRSVAVVGSLRTITTVLFYAHFSHKLNEIDPGCYSLGVISISAGTYFYDVRRRKVKNISLRNTNDSRDGNGIASLRPHPRSNPSTNREKDKEKKGDGRQEKEEKGKMEKVMNDEEHGIIENGILTPGKHLRIPRTFHALFSRVFSLFQSGKTTTEGREGGKGKHRAQQVFPDERKCEIMHESERENEREDVKGTDQNDRERDTVVALRKDCSSSGHTHSYLSTERVGGIGPHFYGANPSFKSSYPRTTLVDENREVERDLLFDRDVLFEYEDVLPQHVAFELRCLELWQGRQRERDNPFNNNKTRTHKTRERNIEISEREYHRGDGKGEGLIMKEMMRKSGSGRSTEEQDGKERRDKTLGGKSGRSGEERKGQESELRQAVSADIDWPPIVVLSVVMMSSIPVIMLRYN